MNTNDEKIVKIIEISPLPLDYRRKTILNFDFISAYNVPFELGVEFDDSEVCADDETPDECEAVVTSESIGGGGGILGFSLCYVQHVPPIS